MQPQIHDSLLIYSFFLLEFLEELNSVRLASITEVPSGHNSNPPVMIHCNEGERTGLTLIADLLLYTLDHNQVSVETGNHWRWLIFLAFLGFGYSARGRTNQRTARQNHSVARSIQIHLLTSHLLSETEPLDLTAVLQSLTNRLQLLNVLAFGA